MTTATLSYRAVGSKAKVVELKFISIRFVYFSGILLSLLMLVCYIYLINDLTKGSYLVKDYNRELATISAENKSLQNNFAESNFLSGVENRARELSFEKTAQVKFVQILDNSLAKK